MTVGSPAIWMRRALNAEYTLDVLLRYIVDKRKRETAIMPEELLELVVLRMVETGTGGANEEEIRREFGRLLEAYATGTDYERDERP